MHIHYMYTHYMYTHYMTCAHTRLHPGLPSSTLCPAHETPAIGSCPGQVGRGERRLEFETLKQRLIKRLEFHNIKVSDSRCRTPPMPRGSANTTRFAHSIYPTCGCAPPHTLAVLCSVRPIVGA